MKVSGILFQYYIDEPVLNNDNSIVNFEGDPFTDLAKFKVNIAGQRNSAGNKDVEISVSLKYVSNFLRALEMPLRSYEVNLILIWPPNWVISNSAGATTFAPKDTKLYVPVVTQLTQNNFQLSQQLKSGFRRTIE